MRTSARGGREHRQRQGVRGEAAGRRRNEVASPTRPLYSWRVWALKARSLRNARGSTRAPGVPSRKAASAAGRDDDQLAPDEGRREAGGGRPGDEAARATRSAGREGHRRQARARRHAPTRGAAAARPRAAGSRRGRSRRGRPGRGRPPTGSEPRASQPGGRGRRRPRSRGRSQTAARTGTASAAAVYLVDRATPSARPSAHAGARPSRWRTARSRTSGGGREQERLRGGEVAEVHDPRRHGQQQRGEGAAAGGRARGGQAEQQHREAGRERREHPGRRGAGPTRARAAGREAACCSATTGAVSRSGSEGLT